MKKISKVVGGLLLIAGISACSSDRNLPLSTNYVSGNDSGYIYINPTAVKAFIPFSNLNATDFNYTISGALAGCQVGPVPGSFSVQPSGTTHAYSNGYVLAFDCRNLGSGTYSGTVTMTTTSGGYNYSGSLPLTVTF